MSSCEHQNDWFDRTLCIAGNMHTVCSDCGQIVDGPCECEDGHFIWVGEETAEAITSAEVSARILDKINARVSPTPPTWWRVLLTLLGVLGYVAAIVFAIWLFRVLPENVALPVAGIVLVASLAWQARSYWKASE